LTPPAGRTIERIVVVGASAGGVEALTRLVQCLPGDLRAPLLVVLHIAPMGTSALPSILTRAGKMQARHALDEAQLEPSRIYVAPPDRHLLIQDGVVRVSRGPRENGHRPAIDPLFRTAARQHGRAAVGLILSGVLDDGSAGLRTLRREGGLAIVQDPSDALYAAMPENAIAYADPQYVLPIEEIAGLLVEVLTEETEQGEGRSHQERISVANGNDNTPRGESADLTCPECGGALWEREDGALIEYECRVGHRYTGNTLVVEHDNALEGALWTALRALEERAVLARNLGSRASARGNARSARHFEERALEAEANAAHVREALGSLDMSPPPEEEVAEA
jgi:two-component system, chemotaxis family, protein-glutamate methylesterase/glutaminase